MTKYLSLFVLLLIASCDTQEEKTTINPPKIIHDTIIVIKERVDTVYVESPQELIFLYEKLPDWFLEKNILDNNILNTEYTIEIDINPFYLEEDFNGNGYRDIAFKIEHIETQKKGFAIIHGESDEIHIIGAGTRIKNGLSDDMSYIDIWKINRKNINEAGVEEYTGTGENGELFLENPSIEIQKSEVGGGQIYWNGNEYAYFHQTC
ncbi:MAG: hypothetical protein ACPG4Z_04530 [Chitinophagales bacterium]